jgi:hypothetical protein
MTTSYSFGLKPILFVAAFALVLKCHSDESSLKNEMDSLFELRSVKVISKDRVYECPAIAVPLVGAENGKLNGSCRGQVLGLSDHRLVWAGIEKPESHFVLLGQRLIQIESNTGPILRLRTSEKNIGKDVGLMTSLTNELNKIRDSYPALRLNTEYRINLGTLLGMDALWDVGPVFAPDGQTVLGHKVKSSAAVPKVMIHAIDFNEENLVIRLVGEQGMQSMVELSTDLIPVRVTKAGFPIPKPATNSVFIVETNGVRRVF